MTDWVWVLMDEANHEGGILVGVFTTIEAAREAADATRGYGPSGGVFRAYAAVPDGPLRNDITDVLREYGS